MRPFRFLILLASLLVFSASLWAQPYRAIPSSGALFRVESHYSVVGPGIITTTAYLQYTDGDTLIDSLMVTRVVHGGDPFRCLCMHPYDTNYCDLPAEIPDWELAYLLQDTLLGKVYWKLPGLAPRLQFDFAALPGDSMSTAWVPAATPTDSVTYYVDSVDTVTYVDGIPRRRVWVHHWRDGDPNFVRAWVEGIGDLYQGLLPQADVRDGGIIYADFHALCYQELGIDLAQGVVPTSTCTMLPSACDLLLSKPHADAGSGIAIQRNPAPALSLKGLLTGAMVHLFTADGRLSLSAAAFHDGRIAGSESLPDGMYLVRVQTGSQWQTVGKWVKQ